MPIVGVTHDQHGAATHRRSVTTKIAIGLPPSGKSEEPQKLDHFVFQKKVKRGTGKKTAVVWEIDEEKMVHYGTKCRAVEIILLDNEPDRIFRTEYAWWSDTQKECWGNGDTAVRRTADNPRGEAWTPCANDDCIDVGEGRCRPSGDLYFLLADYPAFGTVAKIHTSSYQSIREMYAALQDIRNYANGHLAGLHVRLSVRTEKSVYRDDEGNRQFGTKQVLGLTFISPDPSQDATAGPDEARAGHAALKPPEIIDPEEEQAQAIRAEFYPASQIKRAAGSSRGTADFQNQPASELLAALRKKIEAAFAQLDLSAKTRAALLNEHKEDLPGLLERLTRELERTRSARQQLVSGDTPARSTGDTRKTNGRVNGSPA